MIYVLGGQGYHCNEDDTAPSGVHVPMNRCGTNYCAVVSINYTCVQLALVQRMTYDPQNQPNFLSLV